jgi:hypothetical protein
MLRFKPLIPVLLSVLFYSCANTEGKYPYTIQDFPKKLQPYLTKIVEKGIVFRKDSALRYMATDAELERLGKSENPVLRAAAYREMLRRKSFNHFEIVMEHLDDTAFVSVAGIEYQVWPRTVTDDILLEAVWKTRKERDKTIDRVLSRHNYLKSAYSLLGELEPQEKYYPIIKDMATRPRRLDPQLGYELGFDDIEDALYGLARFKKKSDVALIKEKLTEHVFQLSSRSFQLMRRFPDTAYLDVLDTYRSIQFYQLSENRPILFLGFLTYRVEPEDFIETVAVQQNDRSAGILETMLIDLAKFSCMPDSKAITNRIVMAIWEHPCPAYAKLREKVKPQAEKLKEWTRRPIDWPERPSTTKKNVRWFD